MESNRIQLCDIFNCTQCHSCQSVCPKQCISFVEGKDGFYIPSIDEALCIRCGMCIKSCHQLNVIREKNQPIMSYAAWSINAAIRSKSSSGGVFSEIAQCVIDRGGIVVGAVMDERLKVHHTFAETQEQLIPMRGSKYVQSDMDGIYVKTMDYLKRGRCVFFTGTPCQVSGLYSFLKKDYENLITCDLICHGVPSQKSFDTYCNKIGLSPDSIAEVSFRYTRGWGLQMATRNHLVSPSKDGDTKWKDLSPRKSYYLRAFTNGLMFNEACYKCQYSTTERVSDLTMADFWGIGSVIPFNHPTSRGVSLLLLNTKKGRDVVSGCKMLFTEERPLAEAIEGNHNLSKCSGRPEGRNTYCLDAVTMPIDTLSKKYNITPSFRDYLRPLKKLLPL